jgi:Mg/Co/Ni transporter MgtE
MPSLAPGATRVLAIFGRADPNFVAPGTITNTASVSAATVDPNLANNSSSVSLFVQAIPIPFLSGMMIALLAALLGVVALVALRR